MRIWANFVRDSRQGGGKRMIRKGGWCFSLLFSFLITNFFLNFFKRKGKRGFLKREEVLLSREYIYIYICERRTEFTPPKIQDASLRLFSNLPTILNFQSFVSPPPPFFFFNSSPPRKYTRGRRRRRRRGSWRGNARDIQVYIRDIGVICSADISNSYTSARRTRKRHFYEEPAGYAYKYWQYIVLAVDRQSFSCVKYILTDR